MDNGPIHHVNMTVEKQMQGVTNPFCVQLRTEERSSLESKIYYDKYVPVT